uniref:uncharacterized protein isoform X2 n=1 Tax=Myxine glutinosa TaxID=7769 RepID=UPI00358EEA19
MCPESSMSEPMKQGALYVQHHKFGKRWRRHWFMLYPNSSWGIARLEYFEMKEGASKPEKAARCSDRKAIRLSDCLSDNRERHQGTSGTNSAGNQLAMEENTLYGSREQGGEFWVVVKKTDAAEHCGMRGTYKLQVNKESLSLKDPVSEKTQYTWPYQFLRRFGRDKAMFTFEAGRRCKTGPGKFTFETMEGNNIFTQVENSILLKRANRSSLNDSEGGSLYKATSYELLLGQEVGEAPVQPPKCFSINRESGDCGAGSTIAAHRPLTRELSDTPALPSNHPRWPALPHTCMERNLESTDVVSSRNMNVESRGNEVDFPSGRPASLKLHLVDALNVYEQEGKHRSSIHKGVGAEEKTTGDSQRKAFRWGSGTKSKTMKADEQFGNGQFSVGKWQQKVEDPAKYLPVEDEVATLFMEKGQQEVDVTLTVPFSKVMSTSPIFHSMSPTTMSSSSAGSTPPRSPLPRYPLLDQSTCRLEALQDVYAEPADAVSKRNNQVQWENNSTSAGQNPTQTNTTSMYSSLYERIDEAPSMKGNVEHIYDEPEGHEPPPCLQVYDEARVVCRDAWKLQGRDDRKSGCKGNNSTDVYALPKGPKKTLTKKKPQCQTQVPQPPFVLAPTPTLPPKASDKQAKSTGRKKPLLAPKPVVH